MLKNAKQIIKKRPNQGIDMALFLALLLPMMYLNNKIANCFAIEYSSYAYYIIRILLTILVLLVCPLISHLLVKFLKLSEYQTKFINQSLQDIITISGIGIMIVIGVYLIFIK